MTTPGSPCSRRVGFERRRPEEDLATLRIGTASLTVGLLALVALPVSGQDVTGTWLMAIDLGSGGTGGVTLVLEQDGAAISGTYTGSYGTSVPLSGTLVDGRIVFSFTPDDVGEITYDGAVAGDTMRGSVTYGTFASGTFEGSMRPPATFVSTAVGYGVLALLLLAALRIIFPGAPRESGSRWTFRGFRGGA